MHILITGGSGMVGKCIQQYNCDKFNKNNTLVKPKRYICQYCGHIVGTGPEKYGGMVGVENSCVCMALHSLIVKHIENPVDLINSYKTCEEVDNHTFSYISSSDCDLREKTEVDNLFKIRKYDAIIHLAAKVGGLYKNEKSNIEMMIDNMRINMNVLEASHKYNINRGIFCLSSCIYPQDPSKYPMTEDMLCESPPHTSNEGYAYSKRMMQILCKHYNNTYNRQYICLSPVNLYGPFDNFSEKVSHVIPALIRRMQSAKETNEDTFEVYGTGKALRQFMFAPDFANIIIKVLFNNNITEGVYNICNDEEFSIKYIVETIANELEYPLENIVYNTEYSDGILKKTVSNKNFQDIMPQYPFMSFNEGINLTVKWFLSNQNNIRI